MTAQFPVKVQKRSLQYQRNGSDKEYHLVLVTNDGAEAIYIERYGRRGTWGQMTPVCGAKSQHTNTFAKKLSEKTKKGYESTRDSGVVDCADIWDVYAALEGYWHKIGPQLVAMFGQDQVDLVTAGAKRSAFAKSPAATQSAEPPPPVQSEAERYAQNPRYGAF